MSLKLETIYTVGATLYAMVRRRSDGFTWNTALNGGDGGFEAWNAGNWAQYAIALTEQATSGYYTADYPLVGDEFTGEVVYAQAGGTPAPGDAPPFSLTSSNGANVAAVAGNAESAANLGASLSAMQVGAVIAGALTASSFPTDLESTTNSAYQGRVVVFTSGVLIQQVGNIISYDGATRTIGVGGPFTAAPAASDTFIIV